MAVFPARYGRWVPILAPMSLMILILHLNSTFRSQVSPVIIDPAAYPIESNETDSSSADTTPQPCPSLPGIEDVLVVLKTGITEAQEKVPVHLRTTLRCIPHKLIVSDFEEDIDGIQTHDVLRNTSELLLANNDFAIYNRARAGGRAALLQQDHNKVANGASGMTQNPGWKLDKWKFLPMVQEARAYRPDAQWYFFIEADTYPFWPNLLAWLEHFDPQEKLYLGNQMQIGATIFAHGGSGFVLSHAAMHSVADSYTRQLEHWHHITDQQWAGDCVLGMALAENGIDLTWSWPHVTKESVWEQDALGEAFNKEQWCYPPTTFHHMTPPDIELLWKFDLAWHSKENHTTLTYSDIFRKIIRPTLTHHIVENWNNFAPEEIEHEGENTISKPQNIYQCAERCAMMPGCIQYRVDAKGKCYSSAWAVRGHADNGVQSGTMMWRVDAAMEKKGKCHWPEWVKH
ncbi:hypothetical protein N7462_004992 [Penicillium macrosclerotiorum]|uniref:uncharacterized protein n=1 Tax=Penicillium macrosclerotiorum TaxID=303699 RepID=UPI002547C872|nr:uncharacterized protein N7462_004992 [Penicillium macrosclerotiorum]KAJ5690600.1 hypothetical protein N7462_004992 [Penicillium macrosclerotiorum]